jgi:hypothetical protein
MLQKQSLISMLRLQDEINALIDPCWRATGNNFLRAAMMEASEAVDHHGWKWWKHQQMDLAQLQLELVDIWHFLLSDWIAKSRGQTFDDLAASVLWDMVARNSVVLDGRTYLLNEMSLLDKLHLQVGLYACGRSDAGLLGNIMDACGMSWDNLTRQYIGKNALNIFRQRHGYKSGTYQKIWFGKEDNEHMMAIAASMDMTAPDAAENLIEALGEVYLDVLASLSQAKSSPL